MNFLKKKNKLKHRISEQDLASSLKKTKIKVESKFLIFI